MPIALDLAMLISMRTRPLLLCCALLVACSTDDDPSDTEGGAGSSAQGGSNNGQAGTNGSQAGTATSTGGKASSGGSGAGKAGASSAGGASSSAGTSSTSAGSGTGGAANAGDMYGDARIRCVDRTNALRATKGLGPIPRLASAEPCVDGQAKSDSESGKAHGAFDACLDQVKGWKGVAQNECPNYGSVEDTLTKCLDAMWAEGPGGGHYDNMTGNSTKTACGFYTTPSGKVWMIQDFWTE
ncbi:MAG TPA: CAP domain-containing protein [Polyangiaceae bacterium]|nr:CAP domain-containing protein [Polyangiaceae bacterium]